MVWRKVRGDRDMPAIPLGLLDFYRTLYGFPFGEFLDLPNGKYDVWVFFEDSGYWAEEHSQHTKRYIYAEGKEVDVVDRSWGTDGESRYLFEHFEPQPDMDVLRYYWEKLYQPRAFSTEVNDGQLNLGVYSEEHLSARVWPP